jgi:hypothetical protein
MGLASALGLGAGAGARALARSVGGQGRRVIALSDGIARALVKAGHQPLAGVLHDGRLELDDATADALCASGLPEDVAAAPSLLRECARVVRDGGAVLVATPSGLTRRGPERSLVCALFLHAGLVELEQHVERGVAVTRGRVRR